MNRIISCNGFFATINYEADSKISFEQSDLFLSHDVGRFITSGDVFQKVADCVSSFLKSDWGCIHGDDIPLNNEALKTGDRILGAYMIDKTKIWIIADANNEPQRRIITVLFPSEY